MAIELQGTAVDRLREIARMAYGSGMTEGSKGGEGNIGMLGGHIVKFNTHRGERGHGVTPDMVISGNNLRDMLLGLVDGVVGDAVRGNGLTQENAIVLDRRVRELLKIKDPRHFASSKNLLERKVVAKVLTLVSRGTGVDLWNEARAHWREDRSKNVQTDFRSAEALTRAVTQEEIRARARLAEYLAAADDFGPFDVLVGQPGRRVTFSHDSPNGGALVRTDQEKRWNLQTRADFARALCTLFGVATIDQLPSAVRKKMKRGDFKDGKPHPLTAYRVQEIMSEVKKTVFWSRAEAPVLVRPRVPELRPEHPAQAPQEPPREPVPRAQPIRIVENGPIVTLPDLYREDLEEKLRNFQALVAERKAHFDADVAAKVLAAVKDDPACAEGLVNLTKDFPKMKNFTQRVKANHEGRKLDCFDLTQGDTLLKMLAGKLAAAQADLDAAVDVKKTLAAFTADLDACVEATATALAKRLASVLSAPLFEDDRTLLVEMALDPAQAEAFEAAFKAARKTYDDNILGRMEQAMMSGKVSAAQQRAGAREASFTVSAAFRKIYQVEPGEKLEVPEMLDVKGKKVAKPVKTDDARGLNRAAVGLQLKDDVRNLFADLFAGGEKTPAAVAEILLAHVNAVQAMMLDPALLGTVAQPGKGKGDAALRELVLGFLAKIAPNLNDGQLSPADFKVSLKVELAGAALARFAADLPEAGRQVLADMQAHLRHSLTDVLRGLSNVGADLPIAQRTLAELGASGLGSFDQGYGKFLANVLDHYFTDRDLAQDHGRMLESLYRNGKAGGTVGEALGALIKGAGPIFQKVLQAIPTEGLPDEIVKALVDVKSGLAPIPRAVIERRLQEAVARNNADAKRKPIQEIEILESLGAASVGQAVKCRIRFKKGLPEDVVIKFLRPGVEDIARREQRFFLRMAEDVGPAMRNSFSARMAGIMNEFDFTQERDWVARGQCYGDYKNYEGLAQINPDARPKPLLSFGTMKVSESLESQRDMLVLELADGKPLDRCNRQARAKLDAIVRRLPKLEAPSGLELVWTHEQLASMYADLEAQRKLLGELIRRFSAELFNRNFDGKEKEGGGFMHGDLHGGNILVDGNKMTIIDFGNSFAFDQDARRTLVKFVVACGYAKGELALSSVDSKLSKRKDYAQILKDVGQILAKGDANDIVARGMAVVQYLQRKNVEVPGPIVNFTETVMRLGAAYDETNALMDDVADVIAELKLSPKADRTYDPYAAFAEELFLDTFDTTEIDDVNGDKPAAANYALCYGDLWDMANKDKHGHVKLLDRETYERSVVPMLRIMRTTTVGITMADGERLTSGAAVRRIETALKLLGDDAFKGGPIAAALMKDLYRVVKLVQDAVSAAANYKTKFSPNRGESLNVHMSVGLKHFNKWTLAGILGEAAFSLWASGGSVISQAERTVARRQVATDARHFLQRNEGRLPLKTRRFVARFQRDHFLWSEGTPEKIFGNSKWYRDDASVQKVVAVLKLNRDKLRTGLRAAGETTGAALENYALLPFAFEQGLAQAIGKLDDKAFATFLAKVASADLRAKFTFLHDNPAVLAAEAIGRVVEASEKHRTAFHALQRTAAYLESHATPLAPSVDIADPEALKTLAKAVVADYVALKEHFETAEAGADVHDIKSMTDYAFMRHLLDHGVIQQLVALPDKARAKALDAFLVITRKNKKEKTDKTVRDIVENLCNLYAVRA